MKRAIIFLALIAISFVFVAALAYPHFALALLGLAILGVIWRLAGGIAETSEEYDRRDRDELG